MNRIHLYAYVVAFLLCAVMVNAVNKYSAEANTPVKNHFKLDPEINVRTVDKPYRMAKLNMLWAKAQVRLTETKLRSLFSELKIHDKEEIAWKHLKAQGLDKEGLKEAEMRHKLIEMRMAPNVTGSPTALFLAEAQVISPPKPLPVVHKEPPRQIKDRPRYHWHIVWRNVIAFVYLHSAALYGLYLCFTSARGVTILWGYIFALFASMGITAGAHRLWAHRAYKAKWPLRVYLAICQTIAFQNHIYEWVRDHRVHHKFTDTDADPHNSKRGFFFSHIGWLMVKKHKDVMNKGRNVDMSDLERDWVVIWQRKLYPVIMPLFCFVLPAWVPCYFWGESLWNSWHVAGVLRYTISLNFTWLVNSAAHIWGTKPYDREISPTENLSVALAAMGEGWHNYHHVFPWDYKAAELGNYRFNLTTGFIDLCAKLGLAYDLKKASEEMVRRRIARTGDGSHPSHEHCENEIWGWNDIDMPEEDKKLVEILNPKMKAKNN